eukprot:1772942-Prorocentrum_lima.AAC.1
MQAALHSCADPPAPCGPVKPAWWGTVCWNREEFSSSIWRFTTDGNEVFYKFVYATKNPQHICFQMTSQIEVDMWVELGLN